MNSDRLTKSPVYVFVRTRARESHGSHVGRDTRLSPVFQGATLKNWEWPGDEIELYLAYL